MKGPRENHFGPQHCFDLPLIGASRVFLALIGGIPHRRNFLLVDSQKFGVI
jgi:hypothetical protein